MKIWELRELGKRDMVLDDGSTDIQNIRIYFTRSIYGNWTLGTDELWNMAWKI